MQQPAAFKVVVAAFKVVVAAFKVVVAAFVVKERKVQLLVA